MASTPDLSVLLHQTFGHHAFRTNQEAVCEAAAAGRDVLLVMPTGAGKSLCYQLPAIARGGTALVISPLIALMDDQAAKLTALGIRTARIHSGLSRDDARTACRDFLDGSLQFLFIAPERLRVPGFPEMLSKRPLALIAIDEAHCISAWGHDFRPDYRTLGDHLPALRPAPVIALTATATPTVQKDIVAQLRLNDPALFIHGFRRSNLGIEVLEMSKPRRNEFTAELLKSEARRPAIVYAPSRKSAEELATLLGKNAAPYHAGLESSLREQTQAAFLSGKIDVVVATIAFGMGIDKADVRTVVHTALPASVESFYQEIGRAGRDGLPSRTVLLHSFADRKMHDFFLERDYPVATELARVAAALTEDFQPPGELSLRLKMEPETFASSVDRLIAQGAAAIDIAGNIRATGQRNWRTGYDTQLAFRRSQIDRMIAFAESQQCRMSAIVQHFGDTTDGLRPCGRCDFCAPELATAQIFRTPTASEEKILRAILNALASRSTGTGKLHTDLAPIYPDVKDRNLFNTFLDALARAGLIQILNDSFTNAEGTAITYKKASLTHEGKTLGNDPLPILIKDTTEESTSTKKSRSSGSKGRTPRLETLAESISLMSPTHDNYHEPNLNHSRTIEFPRKSQTRGTSIRSKVDFPNSTKPRKPADPPPTLTATQQHLETKLRAWRKTEAAKLSQPAFCIFADRVLLAIAMEHPRTADELQTIPGIGPAKLEKFGDHILTLCNS